MNKRYIYCALYLNVAFCILFGVQSCRLSGKNTIVLSCLGDNDLYMTLKANKIPSIRYDTPAEAIRNAEEGSGVMILADGYPARTTDLDSMLFVYARMKNLRLYVEYPSNLPGIKTGLPQRTKWERVVVSSDIFAPALEKFRVLAIHDCHFVPMKASNPDLVVARVAGYDHADYGLPEKVFPILNILSGPEDQVGIMVSTTKLSQFITGRYAPAGAWQVIWKQIFTWLEPDITWADLKWIPGIRPAYPASGQLPEDVERTALKKGIDWYFNSRMVVSPAMMAKYSRPSNGPEPASFYPDLKQDWPFGHRVSYMPDPEGPVGNGSLGVLEGFDSQIFYDGTQPVRWWRRGDCNGEVAGAMVVSGVALQDTIYQKTGENIGNWLYSESLITQGNRANPGHPAYGLLGWTDVPEYTGPGSVNCYDVYYGDDEARNMLGMILAGSVLKTKQYEQRLLTGLLANLRLTGPEGFQPDRIDQADLEKNGWRFYFNRPHVSYSGNFQAYMWACFLWAYDQTKFQPFLERAKAGISMMMEVYPHEWGITGIQTDRARMILPLAWLLRIEDTPRHRSWLHMIVNDMNQDYPAGAIPERIEQATTKYGTGHYKRPLSNEAYGTTESSVIQNDGDPCCDLLYTVNFAFVGLHEAAAITRDHIYREAEDRLAEFLCRVQIASETHPEFNGGWFRAFDFKRWEYWGSNTDMGWGAWCIESGWSQSWITIVLAFRQLGTSFWDITRCSTIEDNFTHVRMQMLPDEVLIREPSKVPQKMSK